MRKAGDQSALFFKNRCNVIASRVYDGIERSIVYPRIYLSKRVINDPFLYLQTVASDIVENNDKWGVDGVVLILLNAVHKTAIGDRNGYKGQLLPADIAVKVFRFVIAFGKNGAADITKVVVIIVGADRKQLLTNVAVVVAICVAAFRDNLLTPHADMIGGITVVAFIYSLLAILTDVVFVQILAFCKLKVTKIANMILILVLTVDYG